MQVAIVGGTGLIGNALIPHLMEAGHSVTLVTRRESASPPPSLRGEGLRVSVWDPARKRGQFPQGVEAVIWDGEGRVHWSSGLVRVPGSGSVDYYFRRP